MAILYQSHSLLPARSSGPPSLNECKGEQHCCERPDTMSGPVRSETKEGEASRDERLDSTKETRMSSFRTIVLLLTVGFANSALGASPHISISLKHGDAKERATQSQLERLLSQYDLTQWISTMSVVIDEDAIPHSHPILTLHTRHLRDDDLLLSTFVHSH
jgi:hypothetical protein